MKLKIQLIVIIIISLFFACNSKSSKEEVTILDGTFQITESGLTPAIGLWVFTEDEISILRSDKMENTFANLRLEAVQKYYIIDDYIYICLCTSNDCLDKGKNYEKLWKIESVTQTNAKRIIIITNIIDASIKVKLERDKSIGLNVKDWE